MSSSTFKSHFNMISLHEPVQRKAAFWTSYVRALKGTEDIRAKDDVNKRQKRAISEQPDFTLHPSSFFDDVPRISEQASTRINSPGYKYLPVSRDTYGYSPRLLSSHNYNSTLGSIRSRH